MHNSSGRRGRSAHIPDLSSPQEQKRLSASGLNAFFLIVEHWNLTGEETLLLLGEATAESLQEMKHNPETQTLNTDQMYRISYLIGVYKALNIANSADLANDWVRLPNTGVIFGGVSPLEYMIKGGIPAMRTVRRLLDARVQGR
jgi:hypothetical protein